MSSGLLSLDLCSLLGNIFAFSRSLLSSPESEFGSLSADFTEDEADVVYGATFRFKTLTRLLFHHSVVNFSLHGLCLR